MTPVFRNGLICFTPEDLFKALPPDQRAAMLEDLACEDAVIKHVSDQILEGWTENLSSGADDYPAKSTPRSALSAARRRIAHFSGQLASKEIARLESALRDREEELDELRKQMVERA